MDKERFLKNHCVKQGASHGSVVTNLRLGGHCLAGTCPSKGTVLTEKTSYRLRTGNRSRGSFLDVR